MTSSTLVRRVDGAITIRRVQSDADYRACQEAQRQAWGVTEGVYVVPVATMVGANRHGGLVLGAFLPEGQAVAMSFGFLAGSRSASACTPSSPAWCQGISRAAWATSSSSSSATSPAPRASR